MSKKSRPTPELTGGIFTPEPAKPAKIPKSPKSSSTPQAQPKQNHPSDSLKNDPAKHTLDKKKLRRIIIILGAILIAAVVIIIILVKIVPSIQEESKQQENEAIKTATQEALKAGHEITSSNNNSPDSEAATIQAFEDRIAATTSDLDKFYLNMQYATYLLWHVDSSTTKAIEIIENSKVPDNEDAKMYQYRMLWDAYYKAGDEEKASYYRQIVINNSHTEGAN